jgi:hypothetical protein
VKLLAEVLADVADRAKLYDVVDGAVRGARRRRQIHAIGKATAIAVAVIGLVGMSALVLIRLGGQGGMDVNFDSRPGRQTGEPPGLVPQLLATPTRGGLAGDAAFIQTLLDRIGDDADGFGMPRDRSRLRVLFAGDVPGGQRIALIAGVTSEPRMIHLSGLAGTSARRLSMSGWEDLQDPIVRSEWRDGQMTSGYALILGPGGYDVSISDAPRYLADGTVSRQWRPEPAGYVLRDVATVDRGLRVRISRGDAILYEAAVTAAGQRRTAEVDVTPLHGRGRPAPRAAQAAADALAFSSGLTGPDIRYVVLWSDDFEVDDPQGGGSGTGQIATVMALTEDGGGPYITLATDTNKQPNSRNHPTGSGVLGDPDGALIAMRLPTFSGTIPDWLQIIAPPAAVRAEVLRDATVLGSLSLDKGIGRISLAAPLDATVRTYDAGGTVVAERPFKDITGLAPTGGYEPDIKGW